MALFGLKRSSLREKDDRGPIGRHLESQSTRKPRRSSHRPSSSSTRSKEPLLERDHRRLPRMSSARVSTMPSNSSFESMCSSRGRSSCDESISTLSVGARYKERLHPGREISLGMLGTYHFNPKGLAAVYDWKAEEGGYIPFQHQKSHRRK